MHVQLFTTESFWNDELLTNKHQNILYMNSDYLKDSLGKYLPRALCEVAVRRPERPIEFLAYHLISLYEKDLELQPAEMSSDSETSVEKVAENTIKREPSQMFVTRLSSSTSVVEDSSQPESKEATSLPHMFVKKLSIVQDLHQPRSGTVFRSDLTEVASPKAASRSEGLTEMQSSAAASKSKNSTMVHSSTAVSKSEDSTKTQSSGAASMSEDLTKTQSYGAVSKSENSRKAQFSTAAAMSEYSSKVQSSAAVKKSGDSTKVQSSIAASKSEDLTKAQSSGAALKSENSRKAQSSTAASKSEDSNKAESSAVGTKSQLATRKPSRVQDFHKFPSTPVCKLSKGMSDLRLIGSGSLRAKSSISMEEPVTEEEEKKYGTTDPFLARRPSKTMREKRGSIGGWD